MLGGDIQADPSRAVQEVSGWVTRIVRQHKVFCASPFEPLDKLVPPWNDHASGYQPATHLDQIVLRCLHALFPDSREKVGMIPAALPFGNGFRSVSALALGTV
jgi:hypothetical protein